MKCFTLLIIVSLVSCQRGLCQSNDSTESYKLKPLEKVRTVHGYVDNQNEILENFRDSFDRSTFLMLDDDLRHCAITAKLIEYQNGKKIKETYELIEENAFKRVLNRSFEDSLFIFSLSRKSMGGTKFLWVFKTPNATNYDSVEMTNPDSYRVCALTYHQERIELGKQIITQKIPIGKPFVFLAISTWDTENNFPGTCWETRQLDDAYNWSKLFNLKHTFLIELTIDKLPLKN